MSSAPVVIGIMGLTGIGLLAVNFMSTVNDLETRIAATEYKSCESVKSWTADNLSTPIQQGTIIPYISNGQNSGNIVVTNLFNNSTGTQSIDYSITYTDGGQFDFARRLDLSAPC